MQVELLKNETFDIVQSCNSGRAFGSGLALA